jgi:hypothetical protein
MQLVSAGNNLDPGCEVVNDGEPVSTAVKAFIKWPCDVNMKVESLRFFLDHNELPERKCRWIRLDRISGQVGEEMKFSVVKE